MPNIKTMITLNDNNFDYWQMSLEEVLISEGLDNAIKFPLPANDHVNRKAFLHIIKSIPESMYHLTSNTRVAYIALENLRNEYVNISMTKRLSIQKEIENMQLQSYDDQSVNNHFQNVLQKLEQIKRSDSSFTLEQQLLLLSATLPKEENWKNLRDAVAMNCPNLEKAKFHIKNFCQEKLKQQKEHVYMVKPRGKMQPPRHFNSEQIKLFNEDLKKNRCTRCHGQDKDGNPIGFHPSRFCWKITNAVYPISNKSNMFSYLYCKNSCSKWENEEDNWVLDSGATSHYKNNKSSFENLKTSDNASVLLADGSPCTVIGTGDVHIKNCNDQLTLREVRLVPEFDDNLMSVSQLTNSGLKVLFDDKEAQVLNSEWKPIIRAPKINDLYKFNESPDSCFAAKEVDWHARFGHPSDEKAKELIKLHPHISFRSGKTCETCIRTKLKQLPYNKSNSRAEQSLELLHADLCGPMQIHGYDGTRYFLVILDDYSKYIEVIILKNKESETILNNFKAFKERMENQLECKIKRIRSDNGLEFAGIFHRYLIEKGIKHEYSVASCHQQNGGAERSIQTIQSYCKRLLFSSCMPQKYWPLAVKSAAYLYNRTPHSAINQRIPIQLFTNSSIPVNVDKLHVFGSVAYRWIHPEMRSRLNVTKFDPPSEVLIFVGYAENADAYLLLNPTTSKVIKERNVLIVDNVFPMCKELENSNCKCQTELKEKQTDNFPQLINVEVLPPPILSNDATDITTSEPTNSDQNLENVEVISIVKENQSNTEETQSENKSEDNTQDKSLTEQANNQIHAKDVQLITEEVNSEPEKVIQIEDDQTQTEIEERKEEYDQPTLSIPVNNTHLETQTDESKDDKEENEANPIMESRYPQRARRPPPKLHYSELGTPDQNPVPKANKADELQPTTLTVVSDHLSNTPDAFSLPRPSNVSNRKIRKPNSYKEAISSQSYKNYWQNAMNEEISSFHENNVYESVEKEEWMRPITTKWVYDIKTLPNGTIDRFKARLVARGFSQKEGIDYEEIFSPVICTSAIRLLLAFAAIRKYQVHQLDIKTAFLYGDIDREIYVEPPPGYEEAGKLWKLKRSLYGLKQAPKCWFNKMNQIFSDLGFHSLKKERCIYIKKQNERLTIIIVYVDDLLIISPDTGEINQIKNQLSQQLKLRDLGQVKRFLGISIERSPDLSYFSLSQEEYIDELVETYNLTDAKPLHRLPSLDTIPLKTEFQDEIDHSLPVRNIVGALLYIANTTRPDISSAVSYLSRYLHQPTLTILRYSKQVLKYLKTTKSLKLYLGDLEPTNLTAYADANFAPEGDRKSQSGGIIKLNGSSVAWLSRKQDTVSQSTSEAEYIALATVTNEVRWIQHLLEELSFRVSYPTVIFEDNQPAIAVCKNQKSAKVTKHVDIKYHMIEDMIHKQIIMVQYLESGKQLADALTKVRSSVQDVTHLLGAAPVQNQTVRNQREY